LIAGQLIAGQLIAGQLIAGNRRVRMRLPSDNNRFR
jgi:hypothetical protein